MMALFFDVVCKKVMSENNAKDTEHANVRIYPNDEDLSTTEYCYHLTNGEGYDAEPDMFSFSAGNDATSASQPPTLSKPITMSVNEPMMIMIA